MASTCHVTEDEGNFDGWDNDVDRANKKRLDDCPWLYEHQLVMTMLTIIN